MRALVQDIGSLLDAEQSTEAGEAVAPGLRWARDVLHGTREPPAAPIEDALATALVEKLTRGDETETLSWLAGLRDQRGLVKAARTAVHRLRTRGIVVASARRGTERERAEAGSEDNTQESGLLSQFDGRGQRIVWLAQPTAKRLLVHRARVSWRGGLLELKSGEASRGEYRRIVRELEAQELITVPVSGELARWYIHRAARRVKQLGRGLPDGYLRASRVLGSVSDDPHPALAVEAQSEGLLELFDRDHLLGWMPDEDRLQDLARKLNEIATSKIIVDEAQRRAQATAVLEGGARDYFESPAARESSRDALLDMAHLALLRGDQAVAAKLRGAASLMENAAVGEHAFALRFIERLFDLGPIFASEAAKPDAPSSSGLIV